MPDREKVIRNLILIIQSKITHLIDTGNGMIELQQLAIDALALLKEQPQIVLCEHCKHRHERTCKIWTDGVYDPIWFCADGERRTE